MRLLISYLSDYLNLELVIGTSQRAMRVKFPIEDRSITASSYEINLKTEDEIMIFKGFLILITIIVLMISFVAVVKPSIIDDIEKREKVEMMKSSKKGK